MATAFLAFAIIVLVIVVFFAAVLAAAIICMTMWAIVKPLMSGIVDAWWDWFERRTGW